MAKPLIIDVSSWQKTINWGKASKVIDGAIIRLGYGDNYTSQDDPYFKYNYEQCKKYGVPVGCYLYSYATNDTHAKSELEHCKRLMSGKTFELGFWFDAEQNGTQSYAPKCIEIVCGGLEKLGYKVGVYANTSWWHNYLYNVTKYPRWVAQYYYQNTCKYKYVMWQYTSDGSISGVDGRCDVSYVYDTSFCKTTPTVVPAPSTSISTSTTVKRTTKIVATSKTIFKVSGKKEPNKKTVKFTAKTLYDSNIRTWSNGNRINTLKKGVKVSVYDAIMGKDGYTWYYIKVNNIFAFIRSDLVKAI